MKCALLCVLLALAWLCSDAWGQDVAPLPLALTEYDVDGGKHTVPATGAIVDINSTLAVKLEKDRIRSQLLAMFNVEAFPSSTFDTLQLLQMWAAEGQELLPKVMTALSTYSQAVSLGAPFDTAAFELAMNEALRPARNILETAISGWGELRPRLNAGFVLNANKSEYELYTVLYSVASEYAAELRTALDAALKQARVYVCLGAWLKTADRETPVHLPGFDKYPVGEFYEKPRWVVAPNEEQLAQLEAAGQTTRQYNQGAISLKTVFIARLNDFSSQLRLRIDSCYTDLKHAVDSLARVPGSVPANVLDSCKDLAARINSYVQRLSRLEDKYASGHLDSGLSVWLDRASADLSLLTLETEVLLDQLTYFLSDAGILSTVRAQGSRTQTLVTDLRNTGRRCESALRHDLEIVWTNLAAFLGIARDADLINRMLLEFGEEVIRHDIVSLPTETSLDLRYTGKRESGDMIVFRLGAGKATPDPESAAPNIQDLQRVLVRMHDVLPHFKTAAGLIFASPTKSTALTRRFQAGPAYSVLLKWGYRNSTFYNTILSPGVGMNISALDFDKDEVLELSLALVGSLLNDYLQGGFGYNIPSDRWYWMFGVNFPMPSIGLPGGSSGSQ